MAESFSHGNLASNLHIIFYAIWRTRFGGGRTVEGGAGRQTFRMRGDSNLFPFSANVRSETDK